jgi:hypothetical protein
VFDTWQVKNILFTSGESTAAIQYYGDKLRSRILEAMHLKARLMSPMNSSNGVDGSLSLKDYVIMDACSHHGYTSLFYNSMYLTRAVSHIDAPSKSIRTNDARKVLLTDVFSEWIDYTYNQGTDTNPLPSRHRAGEPTKWDANYILYDQSNQSFPCARCCGISQA